MGYIIIEEELFTSPVNICSYFGFFQHTSCRFSNQSGDEPSRKEYDKEKQYRYWFRRFDNPRLERYRADRNKRKILASEPLRYGASAGAAATAAAAGLTVLTAGTAAGVGAAAAGTAYATKKGWRWGRTLYAKTAKRNIIKLGQDIENEHAVFTVKIKKQLSGKSGDVEQMRFWINKRRISRVCYLIRMILKSYKNSIKYKDEKMWTCRCNLFRLTNGELRRCLEEINMFNIVLNRVEEEYINKIFSPQWVKAQLEKEDGTVVGKRLKKMYRERFGIVTFKLKNFEGCFKTYLDALGSRHANGNGFAIFHGIQAKLEEMIKKGKGQKALDYLKEFLSDEAVIAPTEAALTVGKESGFAEIFSGEVFSLFIGTGFAIVEAFCNYLIEAKNLKNEVTVYRSLSGKLFNKQGIISDLYETSESIKNFDMLIIALRTMLKDGGMFEEMIDRFRELYTKAQEIEKKPHENRQDLKRFIESYEAYLAYLAYKKVYNDYMQTIRKVIETVNQLKFIKSKLIIKSKQKGIHPRKLPSRSESELKVDDDDEKEINIYDLYDDDDDEKEIKVDDD